jgi:hypothetical protein
MAPNIVAMTIVAKPMKAASAEAPRVLPAPVGPPQSTRAEAR